jgi:hypothetical protein
MKQQATFMSYVKGPVTQNLQRLVMWSFMKNDSYSRLSHRRKKYYISYRTINFSSIFSELSINASRGTFTSVPKEVRI